MPIAKEILDMFEFLKIFSLDNYFDECHLSQQRSVPTDRQTLWMQRYRLIESHHKVSVALWVHPLMIFL